MSGHARRRAWAMVAATVALGSTALAVPAAAGPTGGALPPQLTLVVPVAGVSGIPLDAVGVAMNVTVTNPAGPGFLTVYPCGELPVVSNLNYTLDQTVPNLVIAALDADGDVCIDTMTTTDVVIDVAGYLPRGSSITPLAQPVRFLDTRDGTGAPKRRVVGGEVLNVPIAGRFGVPADASGAVANVTAVNPDGGSFVTVFPCGQAIPETSSLNYPAGAVVPNLAVTGLGGGSLCLYSPVTTDLLVDVAAYLPADATGVTALAKPVRVIDTRSGLGVAAGVLGTGIATLTIAGVAPVPSSATAAVVNITAIGRGVPGFITAWPAGQPRPGTSNANFRGDQVVANASIVPLGGGAMSFAANTAVDLVVDITGYISGVTAFVPMSPVRLYDSREGLEPACHVGVVRNNTLVSPSFAAFDLGTGAARPAPQVGAATFAIGLAAVNAACHVFVFGLDTTIAQLVASEYQSTGEFVGTRRVAAMPYVPMWLGSRLVTVASIVNRQAVVDVFTGEPVIALPNLGIAANGQIRTWNGIGGTSDGTMVAVSAASADPGPTSVEDVYYVLADGTLLDVYSVPVSDHPISMSPDGSYLLSFRRLDISGTGVWVVTTLDGEVVASMPQQVGTTVGRAEARAFVSPGVIDVCVTSPAGRRTAYRWDIFAAPKPWVTGADVPCLTAVG